MKHNPYYSKTDKSPLNVSDEKWKEILDDKLYYVARMKGTEPPFVGEYTDETTKGNYFCRVCGNHLFHSSTKYHSGCGWPSFKETVVKDAMKYIKDLSHNMIRTEVICSRCDSHLGHVFEDGPPPLFTRYCINSICLDFVPDEE